MLPVPHSATTANARVSCCLDKISQASSRCPLADSQLTASHSERLLWRSQDQPRSLSDRLRAPGCWPLGLPTKPALCPLCPFRRKLSAAAAGKNAITAFIAGISHPLPTRGSPCPGHIRPLVQTQAAALDPVVAGIQTAGTRLLMMRVQSTALLLPMVPP